MREYIYSHMGEVNCIPTAIAALVSFIAKKFRPKEQQRLEESAQTAEEQENVDSD